MKGVIFTEFIDLVEEKFGLDTLDQIIQGANLPNEGAYTTVGTYDHVELLRMVGQLHAISGIPVSDLAKVFGQHLFGQLAKSHKELVGRVDNVMDLLANVENVIHVEVEKLYPDAELPTLNYRQLNENECEIAYESSRPFADVCEGLIRGAADYFGENFELEREDLEASVTGGAARFRYRVVSGTSPETEDVACSVTSKS